MLSILSIYVSKWKNISSQTNELYLLWKFSHTIINTFMRNRHYEEGLVLSGLKIQYKCPMRQPGHPLLQCPFMWRWALAKDRPTGGRRLGTESCPKSTVARWGPTIRGLDLTQPGPGTWDLGLGTRPSPPDQLPAPRLPQGCILLRPGLGRTNYNLQFWLSTKTQ